MLVVLSWLLTTFITPFGQHQFNKLPFGITSAAEHFQRRMSQVLSDLQGVVCLIDDVLVHRQTKEGHDTNFRAVLEILEKAGATMNTVKRSFHHPRVQFLQHIFSEKGVAADPGRQQHYAQSLYQPTPAS